MELDLTPPTPAQRQVLEAGLSAEERRVLLAHGTEAPFCGIFLDNKRAGTYCCRLCGLYDRSAYQQCREPTVEEVRDKERANFCDHYKPVAGAFKGGGATAAAATARSELDKLFGK